MARTDFTDTQRLALVLSFLENNEAQRSLTLEQARLVISKLLFDTTRVEFCKVRTALLGMFWRFSQ